MQSPYLTLPIKEGDLGIALNCSFLFEDMIEENQIAENLPSTKENGLFFIPLVSKGGFKGEVGKTTLSSQDHTSSVNLSEKQIELKSGDTTNAQFGDNSIELNATQQTGLIMGSDISLVSGSTIEVKGVSATLGEILGDILTMLTSMNADPVAGNGAPLASPSLTSQLPQIQAKVQGNLK